MVIDFTLASVATRIEAWFADKMRMGWWFIVAAAAAVAVVLIMPQQVPVAVWKLALITGGSFLGYWIDRHMFPYARPHALGADDENGVWTKYDPYGIVYAACMLRRALIIVAVMLAIAIAL